MNPMLSDEDLVRLLEEAAGSYDVPESGPSDMVELATDAVPARPRLQRRLVQLTGVAAAVAVAAVLAQSVGNPFANSQSVPTAGTAGVAGVAGADVGAGAGGAAPAPADGSLGAAARPPAVADGYSTLPLTSTTASVVSPTSSAVGAAAPGPADTARVVRTGTLTLAVDDGKVPATLAKLRGVVTGAQGYVASGTSQELGDSPTGQLTFRVPVAAFDGVVEKVRGLGAKVVSAETSGNDVTATYADTETQIASLKAARDRFLTILAKATTINEILSVQQRVDGVQASIDRLEGQRRLLADQSDLATLTVSVYEEGEQALVTEPASGFSKAWDDAQHGFSSGIEGLIARSGRTLLVLLVAALALVVGRFGWRVARRRLV